MRRTRCKTQAKRKAIALSTATSLTEKYGLRSQVWAPPAVITKHLQNLSDDSIVMDTDPNETDFNAVPVAASKSNDIIMKDVVDGDNSAEKIELSAIENMQMSEKQDNETVNTTEMAVDSSKSFEASQPLFDDDVEEFEYVPPFQAALIVPVEQPIKMDTVKTEASEASQLSDGKCAAIKEPFSEKAVNDNNSTDGSPTKKNLKRRNSEPLEPLILQLTGNIVGEDFASKLCRLNTTDELINLCAEQTLRVDQLMDELFSMSERLAKLLDNFKPSIDE